MWKALALPIALFAAACSPPAADQSASSESQGPQADAPAAPSGPISGTGAVTAVDAAAGTVTLSHDPIAAISWPAMTMQFTVEDPAILVGLAEGDRVSFELKSADEAQTITMIREQ